VIRSRHAEHTTRISRRWRTAHGFTLVEIIVALTLLSLILVGIAQMTMVLSRRTRGVSAAAARAAIMTEQVNRYMAMPWTELPAVGTTGPTPVTDSPLPHTRKVIVEEGSGATQVVKDMRRVITIIITPLNTAYRPDTIVVRRMKPAVSPLRTAS
jgi:prepilin-type N-terminal cleavage/methylation domain-containing protein